METVLLKIPDKIVADDIRNFLINWKSTTTKTPEHLFSNIYEGRTLITPNTLIEYKSSSDFINLYEGGVGLGHYIGVGYLVDKKKYVYYTCTYGNPVFNYQFETDKWDEMYTYAKKEMLELFIHFNKSN